MIAKNSYSFTKLIQFYLTRLHLYRITRSLQSAIIPSEIPLAILQLASGRKEIFSLSHLRQRV